MTTINRVYDRALGRSRNPYAWELPAALTARAPARQRARDERRAARDARRREARQR